MRLSQTQCITTTNARTRTHTHTHTYKHTHKSPAHSAANHAPYSAWVTVRGFPILTNGGGGGRIFILLGDIHHKLPLKGVERQTTVAIHDIVVRFVLLVKSWQYVVRTSVLRPVVVFACSGSVSSCFVLSGQSRSPDRNAVVRRMFFRPEGGFPS